MRIPYAGPRAEIRMSFRWPPNMHKSKRAAMPKGRGTVGKVVVQGLFDRAGFVFSVETSD
jgi:hypothetical protein